MGRAIEEIIQNCQLFAEVDTLRRRKLAEISRICQYAKQQMVFRQGQDCPGVFIVDTGIVRVFKTAPTGKEHVLHMVAPGQTFAEVAAVGNFPCPAHAEAVEPTRCVLIPVDRFREQMASDHSLCLEMMTGMSFWVRRLISLMEDLVLRDALGRTARFLLESEPDPEGMIRLPSLKRHVASHLNLTSETLSRTLSRLIEAGLVVEYDKSRVQLRNLPQLRAVSEGKYPEI
ncbi:MAG: Crp/Fnr family transcriptional regulator [Pirellulaceae bacterium]